MSICLTHGVATDHKQMAHSQTPPFGEQGEAHAPGRFVTVTGSESLCGTVLRMYIAWTEMYRFIGNI